MRMRHWIQHEVWPLFGEGKLEAIIPGHEGEWTATASYVTFMDMVRENHDGALTLQRSQEIAKHELFTAARLLNPVPEGDATAQRAVQKVKSRQRQKSSASSAPDPLAWLQHHGDVVKRLQHCRPVQK